MQLTVLQPTLPCQIPLYEGDVKADLATITTRKQALAIIGGLSNPSKMPCYTYNLPASRCKVGARLRQVPGSVCFGCYAADTIEWKRKQRDVKGGRWTLTRYCMHQTQSALERRYQCLSDPLWVPAMIFLIRHFAKPNEAWKRPGVKYFRWHDSGDIQDANHLANIITVVRYTANVRHWLPTREYGLVTNAADIPQNLVIRLSAHMENGAPPNAFGLPTSTVSTGEQPKNGGSRCNAYKRAGKCGSCRKCWNPAVQNIDYKKH
jgi:hypothetical protein|tara:strand:+ start:430 stop:1218 length:789 start_codon:yes stop_codon:yes gene_type:complete